MDNLTHSLVGALLGQAGLKRKTGLAMPALIIGANLPDIDATCTIYGIESLAMRRGLTHGPIAWVLLPLALAGILWAWDRWQTRRGKRPEARLPVHFGWLYALAFLACLTHPALDWLNSYGIRFLEPFSSRWFYGDALFIIDLWLWLGLGFATWFSLSREKRGKPWRWPAVAALMLTVVYAGANWAQSQWLSINYAINEKVIPNEQNNFERPTRIPRETMIAAPVALWPAERELIFGSTNRWFIVEAGEIPAPRFARPVSDRRCAWPEVEVLKARNPDLRAFLFWSRAPFVERHANGTGIVFRDARFASRSVGGDRFSVAMPDEPCEPPAQGL